LTEKGWEFAVDLSDLKTIASVDLPAISYTFAELNNVVARTNEHDREAFALEGAGGLDQVHPEWSYLRDLLRYFLGETSLNLQIAADVLLSVVDAYANTDAEAKRSLEAAWRGGPPALQDGEVPPPGAPRPVDTTLPTKPSVA
jgi:hypothetical protein